MGLYVDLSADDKRILAAWEATTRSWVNGLSRLIVEARGLKASLDTGGGAGDILDSLDAGEVIPNSGGLSGALNLTKEEWATLRSAGLNDYLTKYDVTVVREIAAKAAGPTAGLDP